MLFWLFRVYLIFLVGWKITLGKDCIFLFVRILCVRVCVCVCDAIRWWQIDAVCSQGGLRMTLRVR